MDNVFVKLSGAPIAFLKRRWKAHYLERMLRISFIVIFNFPPESNRQFKQYSSIYMAYFSINISGVIFFWVCMPENVQVLNFSVPLSSSSSQEWCAFPSHISLLEELFWIDPSLDSKIPSTGTPQEHHKLTQQEKKKKVLWIFHRSQVELIFSKWGTLSCDLIPVCYDKTDTEDFQGSDASWNRQKCANNLAEC